jgi:hypothetical protein
MFTVPGLDDVRCAWVDIKAQGFVLHGFLTFLASDRFFPEYLESDGLGDLDLWSGRDCAIFVVQSPSAAWIQYTKSKGHPWWQLFGKNLPHDGPLAILLTQHGAAPLLSIDGTTRTFDEIFRPRLDQLHHKDEIGKILHRFGLRPTDHPSLILFHDLSDRAIWHIDLKDLVSVPQAQLRQALQTWFSGPDFKRLMEKQ